jgi:antitoxin ParD1/3/4
MPQRNVTITEHQDKFVKAVLKSGQYGNVSEVFRAGLRLLEREEQARLIEQEIIQRNIEKGIIDIREGRYTPIDTSDELCEFFAAKQTKRKK